MCCFSVYTPSGLIARLLAPKIHVSDTNIYARMIQPGVQALAYGMNFASKLEVAMVLPLPVAPASGEDAVRFIDLSEHPRMFVELANLFEWVATTRSKGPRLRLATRKLIVHDIGSFVASYVPNRADFARLDERFRMPDALFDAVPRYADYGFAVFQLKPGNVTVHPMGLSFPTREPDRLFFPTIHVHDGRFRAKAKFDHALYYQRPSVTKVDETIVLGQPTSETASWMTPTKDYRELVVPDLPMLRQHRRGKLANDDIWVPAR